MGYHAVPISMAVDERSPVTLVILGAGTGSNAFLRCFNRQLPFATAPSVLRMLCNKLRDAFVDVCCHL